MAIFFSRKFKPKGPIKTPDNINPMIPGSLNFRRIIGAIRIIISMSAKMRTGFVRGKVNLCKMYSKNPSMSFFFHRFLKTEIRSSWIPERNAGLNITN
jgi:hypothetical protein